MNLVAVTYEALHKHCEIHEWQVRTGPESLDTIWLDKLGAKLKSMPKETIYRDEMLEKIQSLKSNEKIAQRAINEFLSDHPQLNKRYDYEFEKAYISKEDVIEFQVPIEMGPKKYMLSGLADITIEKRDMDNRPSAERLQAINEDLNKGKISYQLEIEEKTNGVIKMLANHSNKKPLMKVESDTINHLTELIEIDLELMNQFIDNNPAFSYYKKQREIIPNILSQCKDNNLIKPVTEEAIKAFQKVVAWEKIESLRDVQKVGKINSMKFD